VNEKAEYIKTNDAAGNKLTGEKNYRIHLPPDIPSCSFWSLIVYDSQTHLMIRTDQPWPSVYSTSNKLHLNEDGSFDLRFGPEAPANKETNWIQTLPGKGWYMILRLYEPKEAWIDGIWRPGQLELL
jgi:hypothetical protein